MLTIVIYIIFLRLFDIFLCNQFTPTFDRVYDVGFDEAHANGHMLN